MEVGRQLHRNRAIEIVPSGEQLFVLRLPLWGQALSATPYQVQLLGHFELGADPVDVIKRFPFGRAESRRFIEDCVACGLLLPQGSQGLRFPARVRPARGFAGAPFVDDVGTTPFVFLGVPSDAGSSGRPGARFGPALLREATASYSYQVDGATFEPLGFFDFASGQALLQGISLADAGDVFVQPGEPAAEVAARTTRCVRQLLTAGAVPLVLGGDHAISHAVMRAYEGRRLGVIQLDAHSDLGESYPRPYLHHGTVMAAALQEIDCVTRLVQIGLRGLSNLAAGAVPERCEAIGMDQLRREGTQAIVDRLPHHLCYYISIDIDVVDPAFAPATGTPVPGGLLPHELKQLVRTLARQREIVGADLVELALLGESPDATAGLGSEILLHLADAIVEGERQRALGANTGEHK